MAGVTLTLATAAGAGGPVGAVESFADEHSSVAPTMASHDVRNNHFRRSTRGTVRRAKKGRGSSVEKCIVGGPRRTSLRKGYVNVQ